MIGTKLITVSIDVKNPINVCSNLNVNVLNILKDKYEGKCYKGALILRIVAISAISDCYIGQLGAPSFGTIDVMFEAEVLYYNEGEIITGCTIVNKDNLSITCITDNACIMLANTMPSLVKDQKITIRVAKSLYKIGSNKISVNAVPFLPSKKYHIYRIVVNPTINLGEYLQPIRDLIVAEEAQIVENNARKFFEHIIYAYKELAQPSGKTVTVEAAIKSISGENPPIYIARDTRMSPLKGELQLYEKAPEDPNGVVFAVELPAHEALLRLLEDHYGVLKAVREMVDIYSGEKDFAAHKNLWAIYAKLK